MQSLPLVTWPRARTRARALVSCAIVIAITVRRMRVSVCVCVCVSVGRSVWWRAPEISAQMTFRDLYHGVGLRPSARVGAYKNEYIMFGELVTRHHTIIRCDISTYKCHTNVPECVQID